jgi:hypothetical protein
MLGAGDEDLVLRRQTERGGDEVQALRRAAREDDLGRRRPEVRRGRVPRLLEGGARLGGERVDAAVDVRRLLLFVGLFRAEDDARLGRRRGGVEVGDLLTRELPLEEGELGAERAEVQRHDVARTSFSAST